MQALTMALIQLRTILTQSSFLFLIAAILQGDAKTSREVKW